MEGEGERESEGEGDGLTHKIPRSGANVQTRKAVCFALQVHLVELDLDVVLQQCCLVRLHLTDRHTSVTKQASCQTGQSIFGPALGKASVCLDSASLRERAHICLDSASEPQAI